ncbi:MAG: YbjN domain-containing protein [Myxococcota bacterium]
MGRILRGIKTFLEEDFDAAGLEPPEDGALLFRYDDGENHEWGCMAVADEDSDQLMFYSVRLEEVPKKRRDAVMRFVTRANYGMHVGNFELDLDDGEVRFKTSIDVEGVELTTQLCRNLVDMNLAVMGRYFEGLREVAAGNGNPEEIIAEIEAEDDDEPPS